MLPKYIFAILIFLILSCATVQRDIPYPPGMEFYDNARFEFRILIPKSFHKQLSQNGDGITLTSPQNKNVEIRAWGSHNALFQTFEEEVAEIHKGEKLLSIQDTHFQSIKGKVILMEEKNQKIMRLVSLHNEIFYGVECSAPTREFTRYQKLFENIIQSFKLIN